MQKYNPKLCDFSKVPTIVHDTNKKIYSPIQLQNARNHFEQILQKSKQMMHFKNEDMSLLDAIKMVLKNETSQINESELRWELLYFSLFTGIEAQYLSAKHWDQAGEFSGDYLLLSSYEDLIKNHAENQNIYLNTIVSCLEYDGCNVKIKTNNGVFIADIAIITVPLGVLQNNKIQFKPALPENKIIAIQNLQMSKLNKIGLLFPYQFWQNDAVIIGYDTNIKAIPLFFNYSYFFEKPILLGAISGDAAIQLEKEGKEAFVELTLHTLRELYGNNIPNPIATITTNWINDPFSQGSYSHIALNASGNDFDILAEPISNKIFFAGEATYRKCHSTVQGAYLSGLREADRILGNN